MDAATADGGASNGLVDIEIKPRPGDTKKGWLTIPAALGIIALLALAGVATYFGINSRVQGRGAASSRFQESSSAISGTDSEEAQVRSASGSDTVEDTPKPLSPSPTVPDVSTDPSDEPAEGDPPAIMAGPAPVEMVAPVGVDPMGVVDLISADMFKLTGACPDKVDNPVRCGAYKTEFPIPDAALEINKDWYAEWEDTGYVMNYPHTEIELGDTYCWEQGQEQIVVGGVLRFDKNGECLLPPTKANGEACCTIFFWHASPDGITWPECTMSMKPTEDGVWYFRAAYPGNPPDSGWGPDVSAHIHYDVSCKACDGNDVYDGANLRFHNKFYMDEVCPFDTCGTEKQHLTLQPPVVVDGEKVYKHAIMVPLEDMERVTAPFTDDKKQADGYSYDPATFKLGLTTGPAPAGA